MLKILGRKIRSLQEKKKILRSMLIFIKAFYCNWKRDSNKQRDSQKQMESYKKETTKITGEQVHHMHCYVHASI